MARSKKRDVKDGYSPEPRRGDQQARDPWADKHVLVELAAHAEEHGEEARLDAYRNELTGIGDYLRDKTFGGRPGGPSFEASILTGWEIDERWRGSDLGATIVEALPEEMTREGWDVIVQPSQEDVEEEDEDEEDVEEKVDAFPNQNQAPPPGAPPFGMIPPKPKAGKLPEIDDESAEIAEEVEGVLEDLDATGVIYEALTYERARGGAAILVGVDDGQELDQPLNEDGIDEVRHLTAFSGGWDGEIVAWSYYSDPALPNYGMPEVYMLRNDGVPLGGNPSPGSPTRQLAKGNDLVRYVHESRLLLFPGRSPSRRQRIRNRGWGDSLFVRVDRVLQQYDQTWGGAANLMADFSQAILATTGLIDKLSADKDQNKRGLSMNARVRALNMGRSLARMLVIDKEKEEFRRDTASLAGIAEMLQQFSMRLAAAAQMPVTLLMGQSPAGLNATGASDVRFFYDRIAAAQRRQILAPLQKLVRLIFRSKLGPTKGEEPERWRVEFRSLFQPTALEQAQERKTVAETDAIYIGQGVLTPEEVCASAFGGSKWTAERQVDFDGREAMAAQEEADAKGREAAAKEQQTAEEKKPIEEPAEDKPHAVITVATPGKSESE